MTVNDGVLNGWTNRANGTVPPLTDGQRQSLIPSFLQTTFSGQDIVEMGEKLVGEKAAKQLLAEIIDRKPEIKAAMNGSAVMPEGLARTLVSEFMNAAVDRLKSVGVNSATNGYNQQSAVKNR